MPLPEAFLDSLKGVEGFERESFVEVHQKEEQVTSLRLNPMKATDEWASAIDESFHLFLAKGGFSQGKSSEHYSPFTIQPVPWSRYGYYLSRRPSFTFDPLFHAGLYYVQEASSMFLERALEQLADLSKPLRVLDLSAAPGGKTTHIQSLLPKESLLVSNEVIRSRCAILMDNVMKWGGSNILVTNNDPAAFEKLRGFFDVIVVDAPCSGSGLFRKDPDAIKEWSLNNVALCSQRQQRILAGALPALKKDGLLIYSTCSYSKEEDEEIGDWLVEEFEMKNEKLEVNPEWGIVESRGAKSGAIGYRFYPHRLKGEGFFISCFRKMSEAETKFKASKIEKASSKDKEIIQPFLKEDVEVLKEKDSFLGLPQDLVNDYVILKNTLNIQYAGIALGQIMKNRLVPHHALALSTILAESVPDTALSYENAIKFLQRAEMDIDSKDFGWQVVSYKNHRLGWINVLPNRINNYYPKELRILKQSI